MSANTSNNTVTTVDEIGTSVPVTAPPAQKPSASEELSVKSQANVNKLIDQSKAEVARNAAGEHRTVSQEPQPDEKFTDKVTRAFEGGKEQFAQGLQGLKTIYDKSKENIKDERDKFNQGARETAAGEGHRHLGEKPTTTTGKAQKAFDDTKQKIAQDMTKTK